jgi:hypothetical protein
MCNKQTSKPFLKEGTNLKDKNDTKTDVKKWDMKVWTESIWLRKETVADS